MMTVQKTESPECPFDRPLYYSAEVARLAKINVHRVHRWLEGYEYTYAERRVSKPPVIEGKKEQLSRPTYASFYDLIELLLVKQFLQHGMSLQKTRKALKEATALLGTHHFAHQIFFTDGRKMCLQIGDRGDAILELLSDGQWVISDVIKQLAHEIVFDRVTQTALRWFPSEGNSYVVLDPCVSFGRPSIVRKGVSTDYIYDLYEAEGNSIDAVSSWMCLEHEEVSAAVNFETHLAA
ncbi:MAG: hypothetical protein IMZ61_08565 [Planctomycetes bacterium]|nr:hypothetical protein [Candidatus Atribacteria bacterium]MBE3143961.1 hypothetical protein [Planctomycetota bacterium]